MSGIAGIIDPSDTGAAREWLRQATAFMAFRGPDGQRHRWDHPVGFGHALLRSSFESEHEHQPLSLDGQVWIVADARLDGRVDLVRRLQSSGRAAAPDAPDVELLLHAYHLWGEACLDHLMGDFAFAIWDAREECLFCARDHFGVTPFYYAQIPNGLIFSNTLNCLRLHPRVSSELNDRAMGDFLLFDMNMDPATTTFAGIQRLPPASTLTWRNGALRIRRYWRLPEWNGYLRYKRQEEYVEQFRELFTQAVADRLRTDRLSTQLSGGLDSTSIAALAQRLLVAAGTPFGLRAFTLVCERLIPDEEGRYARMVAEATGIPTEFLGVDDLLETDPSERAPGFVPPEPGPDLSAAPEYDLLRQAAAHGRVLLCGLGGDPALMFVPSYWMEWLRSGQLRRLLAAQWHYVRLYRRRPPLYWRAGWRHWRRIATERPSLPDWFHPDLVAPAGLPARLEAVTAASWARIDLRGMATDPFWSNLFGMADPSFTGLPIKIRFPFFDLRLAQFLQAVPPVPWLVRKHLLREAMREVLPEPVRRRPKTPLAGDPHQVLAQRRGSDPHAVSAVMAAPGLDRYVDRGRLVAKLQALDEMDSWTYQRLRTAVALASWLHRQYRWSAGGEPARMAP